ncbi:MFS transporter [Companilactobacillus sp. RD055328]|uniref:MFS transporter n=1 Tax=Companilactobacillus sp. RD055328 TaxID=2916634 RepID=UPI001FC7CB82|nr:MFS transporter [Companilactobacillus sp. RD055328]GKQ42454.1 MFS transporter [Companilactobacillus sp. RD055328]
MREQRRWLLILNTTFNMVLGFILPVNTIFINKNLGEPLMTAGFVLMVYSGTMMVGNAIGGVMFDKFSKRGTLLIGYAISITCLLIMSFHHVWPSYAFILAVLGFGMGLSYTAINAYTAFMAEQAYGDTRVIFNNMYLAANMGIALGSTAVGFIFKASIFWTFFTPVIFFALSIIIVLTKGNVLNYVNDKKDSTERKNTSDIIEHDPRALIGNKRFVLNLMIISLSVFLVWVGYSQWDSNMSVYILDQGLTTRDYGLVFTANAASLLIIQPIVNRFISKIFKQFKYQLLLGTVIMGSSFLLLPSARTFWAFIVSMLVLTLGESMVFPTIPALLSKLSTRKNRGTIQSIYSIFGSLGRAAGPYVGSLIITWVSYSSLFIAIAASMVLVGIAMLGIKEQS